MLQTFKNGQGSIVLRAKLLDSSKTDGSGLTGLTSASTGLIISTIADVESGATAYTVAGSTIETITTLGTYAAPTATKCRFKEVDSTNHKGIYEFQFADARFAVSSAKSLLVSVSGATNLAQADFVVQLQTDDPYVAKLTSTTAAAAVWDADMGSHDTSGTAGWQLTNINAYGAPPSAASIRSEMDANSTKLANLDATISSRLASSSYTAPPSAATIAATVWDTDMGAHDTSGTSGWMLTAIDAFGAPPTAASIRSEMDANSTKLANLDATISSRLASASYTAPPSAATIASTVWDVDMGAHDTSGTAGWQLTNASSAGDPWSTALPGGYVAGSAGYILGTNLNATVSSRSTFAGGAVASVTGNVGGNVVGSVGSVTGLTASNLDVAVSTRLASASYTSPPPAATVATAVWDADMGAHDTSGTAGWQLTNANAALDVAVSTRAATGAAMTLTSGERTSIADALLDRDMSVGADSGTSTVRTVRQSLRFNRNKWTVSGAALTVYKEDDATTSHTGVVTTDNTASPVTAVDPAG